MIAFPLPAWESPSEVMKPKNAPDDRNRTSHASIPSHAVVVGRANSGASLLDTRCCELLIFSIRHTAAATWQVAGIPFGSDRELLPTDRPTIVHLKPGLPRLLLATNMEASAKGSTPRLRQQHPIEPPPGSPEIRLQLGNPRKSNECT